MRIATHSRWLDRLPWFVFTLVLAAGCSVACADSPPPDSQKGEATRTTSLSLPDAGISPTDGPDANAALDAAAPAVDAAGAAVAGTSGDEGMARAPDPMANRLPAVMEKRLEGVVNVNAASPEELRMLSGIGPAKIRAIMLYRQAHPFRTVEELVRIKGIGRKMVRRLRMHLAVSGPTTAQQVIRPSADVTLPPPAPIPLNARNPPRGSSGPARPSEPPALVRTTPRPASRILGTGGTASAASAASAGRAGRPARPLVPGVVFPDATSNHCPRPR